MKSYEVRPCGARHWSRITAAQQKKGFGYHLGEPTLNFDLAYHFDEPTLNFDLTVFYPLRRGQNQYSDAIENRNTAQSGL
jgi:hypothetical protein